MRGNFAWWDQLVGSLMPGHAATGSSPGQPGEIIVEDTRPPVHPAPRHQADPLGARGRVVQLRDERPRHRARAALDGRVHVRPGRQRDGLRPSDRLVQALRRAAAPSSPRSATSARTTTSRDFCSISWAASSTPPASRRATAAAPCGRNFEKVTLDDNTSAPFALDVAPDGRVFFTELVRGQIRVYDPQSPERQDRAHARRLLGRRGRPARHRARPRFRRQRLALRLLRARQAEQRRSVELLQPLAASPSTRARRSTRRPSS